MVNGWMDGWGWEGSSHLCPLSLKSLHTTIYLCTTCPDHHLFILFLSWLSILYLFYLLQMYVRVRADRSARPSWPSRATAPICSACGRALASSPPRIWVRRMWDDGDDDACIQVVNSHLIRGQPWQIFMRARLIHTIKSKWALSCFFYSSSSLRRQCFSPTPSCTAPYCLSPISDFTPISDSTPGPNRPNPTGPHPDLDPYVGP